jgi:hypothetical protein
MNEFRRKLSVMRNFRSFFPKLLIVIDVYSVPAAAAVVGWILAALLQVDGVLRITVQGCAAVVCFFIANRYLN